MHWTVVATKGLLRGRLSAGKGLEVRKHGVCLQSGKFGWSTRYRRKAVEDKELISRWALEAQSLECQAKKFGFNSTSDGRDGEASEGTWKQIGILERSLKLQSGGWVREGKLAGRKWQGLAQARAQRRSAQEALGCNMNQRASHTALSKAFQRWPTGRKVLVRTPPHLHP